MLNKRNIMAIVGICFINPVWAWSVVEDPKSSVFTQEESVALLREVEPAPSAPAPAPVLALTPPRSTGIFEKKAPTLEPSEIMVKDYHAALHLMNSGSELQGEQKLIAVLQKNPRHREARAQLATLYLKQERELEAETYLLEGLKQEEHYPEYLRLQAIVHERKNEPTKALHCLEKIPLSVRNHKTIMALKGNLYQQIGHYKDARQQYVRLLRVEPHNTAWLLGLSIALDSEGEKESAIEGYQQLRTRTDIAPEIADYVESRLKDLKG